MQASDLKVGELVDITITGVRVVGALDNLNRATVAIPIHTDDDDDLYTNIPLGSNAVKITRRKPDEWPPQTDDVWADRQGKPWVAINRNEMVRGIARWVNHENFWSERGPARLVYRRDK